jgi:hypothetical protein
MTIPVAMKPIRPDVKGLATPPVNRAAHRPVA